MIMTEIMLEVERARNKHPERFHSPHEAYAILLEEIDEVWDEIKRNDSANARKELIQVGAVVYRFLDEVLGETAHPPTFGIIGKPGVSGGGIVTKPGVSGAMDAKSVYQRLQSQKSK